MLGDHYRHAERNLRAPLVGFLVVLLAGLERSHGLFQHRLVEFVADFLDVAGLFFAQKIAGAADVEVVAGQLESGAEALERLQHGEAALCRIGKLSIRRNGK